MWRRWRASRSASPRTSARAGSRARSRARSGQTFTDLVVEVHDDATPGRRGRARSSARFDDPRLTAHPPRGATPASSATSRARCSARETRVRAPARRRRRGRPAARRGDGRGARRAPERRRRARALRADRRRRATTLVAERDWLGTPSPPLERGADFVAKSMLHGCRICSSTALIRRAAVPEGALPAGGLPAVRLRVLAADGRAAGTSRSSPEPLCRYRRARAQPHVGAERRSPSTGYLHAEQTLREVHAVKRRHVATLPAGPRRTELRADRGPRAAARPRRPRARADAPRPAVQGDRARARRTPRAASPRCCASRPRGRCWPAACSGRARSSG